jgi:molybdate transport system permease protein
MTNKKKSGYRIHLFRAITTGILILLTGTVALIILADIAYINASSLVETLSTPEIQNAFILSLISSFIATALAILIGVPTAYALSRFTFRGISVLDVIIDLLIVLPVLVIGVSLLVFFRFGNELAESGIWPLTWLGSAIGGMGAFFIYTKAGVVLAQFFCVVSFAVRTIKAGFDAIDPRTEQVAMTLGCTHASAFWRITLPLAKPAVLAGALLSWARAVGIFGAVAIVAGAVRNKTEVLPTSIYLEISIGRLEVALSISLALIAAAFIRE